MTISMYTSSVPVFKRQLGAVLHWLDKADAHAQARRFHPSNYLQLRLAPDMLPLVWQIRIAGDTAKGCVARLAAIEPPKFEDDETRFDELRARLRRTIDFVESVGPHAVPRDIVFEKALPRTRSGKIMRRVARAQLLGLPVGDLSGLED